MTNKKILKKKIVYRATHRGSKEMDILLGNFVKNHIRDLNNEDLNDLERLLNFEDEITKGSMLFNKGKINNPILQKFIDKE